MEYKPWTTQTFKSLSGANPNAGLFNSKQAIFQLRILDGGTAVCRHTPFSFACRSARRNGRVTTFDRMAFITQSDSIIFQTKPFKKLKAQAAGGERGELTSQPFHRTTSLRPSTFSFPDRMCSLWTTQGAGDKGIEEMVAAPNSVHSDRKREEKSLAKESVRTQRGGPRWCHSKR